MLDVEVESVVVVDGEVEVDVEVVLVEDKV